MLFQKKKKKNPALKIVAIIVGILATMAAGYVIFDKFIKNHICRGKKEELCDCDACCEDEEEDSAEDACTCSCCCEEEEPAAEAEA